MRRSNLIVAEILEALKSAVRPGVATRELDEKATALLAKTKGRPAFKGYNGYPAALCTSVNEEVVHGIPSGRILKEGDIVSLDFGVIFEDYFGDAAITLPVGRISPEAEELLRVARGGPESGDREGPGRKSAPGHFGGDSERGGKPRLFGGSGFCRPRDRPASPRKAPDSQLRDAGAGNPAAGGNDPGHRAHDQRRRL